jgi:phosphatidylserine/phosphatidylglycerophosphate/cardiolipin synthase-like enzyme
MSQLLLDDEFISFAAGSASSARSRIWVMAYAWRWYENEPQIAIQKFNVAMLSAAKQGIDVRILIDQYTQAKMLQSLGFKARILPTQRAAHGKVILIDSDYIIVGSHNLTKRGTQQNYEASVVNNTADAVDKWVTYFERMWDNYSTTN